MSVSIVPTLDMERAIAASGYDVIVGFDEVGCRIGCCRGKLRFS